MTQGGYASHIRSHEYFTFKIPDALQSEIAAPMLCAGITGKIRSITLYELFSDIRHSLQSSREVRHGTWKEDCC